MYTGTASSMRTKAEYVDRIKILEIIQTIGIGGAEMVTFNTVTHLDRSRFDVRALVVGGGPLVDRMRERGYEVDTYTFKGSYDWNLIRLIRKLIRTHNIDIVHTHLSRMNSYGFVGSWFTPATNVMNIHGLGEFSNFLGRVYYNLFGNLSGKIVAVSQNLADRFLKETMVRRSKMTVIPNGIDLDRFNRDIDRANVLKRFGIPADSKLVLAVGNIRAIKGYEFLIESFARVANIEPAALLMICGNDYFDYKRNLIPLVKQLNLSERVMFMDFVTAIESLYAAADVYALTSISEGFSLTTVEAMASSAAVVSTDCVGPKEIIDNGVDGVIVPGRDPDQFGREILDLLRDPERRLQMGQAARRKVEEKYSLDESIKRFEELFLSLAGS